MAFQTFDPPGGSPDDAARRLAALRETFAGLHVDGVVVPHEDEYQSESVPPAADRLRALTGFTGSAGRAIVLSDRALFATDGRYTLQAAKQVDGEAFTIVSTPHEAKSWMAEHVAGRRLGVDPMLHSRADLKRLEEAGATVVRLAANPVDAIWTDRPAKKAGQARAHPAQVAGRSAADKLGDVREAFAGDADALFIAASDTVSWLFNWRGDDVAHTPLVLSRAFVPSQGPVTVFADPEAVAGVAAGLNHVEIVPPSEMIAALTRLSEGLTVRADPAHTPDAALGAIDASGTLNEGADPSARLKAIKNPAEIAGMRAAHHRDGLAMVRFLAWFDDHAVGLTEIDLVERLEAERVAVGALDGSFDTIAGSGPNGAIVHYRVDRASNRTVEAGDPVLLDSGAQYPNGTTDITRTMVAGSPSEAFRRQYTLVLKGHIAIARQRFPERTMGSELDGLARAALWQAGHDYLHGTGHGVGAHLSVHEGPAGISKRSREPLAPGMILSNEPGDYHEGAYGIRIENLVLVREPAIPPGGTVPMLSFETITLCPIDTRLVLPGLLSGAEVGWLDCYHARVYGALVGHLDAAERRWLAARTRPLAG